MAYEGRRFFSTESVEEKTRKYTRPYPIVTSHLRNLQKGHQVMPPVIVDTMLPTYSKHSPSISSLQHERPIVNNNRKRRYASASAYEEISSKRGMFHVSTIESSSHSKYKQLSDEILQYSKCHQQSMDLLHKKLNLRSALLSVFRRQFPTASLHLVGSSCNGFANETSDADFCLMLTQSRNIDQRNEACLYLKQMQKMLHSMACVRNLLFIRAKVPILKFKDSISGCECDINLNNAVGIRNTHLLRTYSKVDSRVRPLIMIVKRWAKSRKINDASQGTLSSYSLVLMVIHYLQSFCDPPVLTSIQQEYPDFFSTSRNVDDLPMFEPADLIPCNSSRNQQSLGELLCGFFKYYATDFKWDFFIISVREGKAIPKSLKWEMRDKYICIEEPFDFTNTARSVHEYSRFNQIKQEFNKAHSRLKENLSMECLL